MDIFNYETPIKKRYVSVENDFGKFDSKSIKIPLKHVIYNLKESSTVISDYLFISDRTIEFEILETPKCSINVSHIKEIRYSINKFIFKVTLKSQYFRFIFSNKMMSDEMYPDTIWFCFDIDFADIYSSILKSTRAILSKTFNINNLSLECEDLLIETFQSNSKNVNYGLDNLKQLYLQHPDKISSADIKVLDVKDMPPLSNKRKFVYFPSSDRQIEISISDLHSMKQDGDLNDNIMNFYMSYIYYDIMTDRQRLVTHFFDVSFMMNLIGSRGDQDFDCVGKKYARVAQFTVGVDIFSKDFLILPMKERLKFGVNKFHWWLVIVCYPGMAFQAVDEAYRDATEPVKSPSSEEARFSLTIVFDSLSFSSTHASVVDIREYLTFEWNRTHHVKEGGVSQFNAKTFREYYPQVPNQKNFTQGAIYALTFLDMFFTTKFEDFGIDFLDDSFQTHFQPNELDQKLNFIKEIFVKGLNTTW